MYYTNSKKKMSIKEIKEMMQDIEEDIKLADSLNLPRTYYVQEGNMKYQIKYTGKEG